MRILYILPIEKDSSGMPYAKRQISSLSKNYGIESVIFYLESRTSVSYLIKASKQLKNMIADFRPDVCHAHYGSVNAIFTILNCPKPIVITFHGSDLNKTPSDGLVADFIARLFSNISSLFCQKIFVVSDKLKNELWWKRRSAEVLPIGTDLNEFYPMDKQKCINELKNEMNFDFPSIVFNANHPKIKRLDLAKTAVDLLKNDYPKAKLIELSGNIEPKTVPKILNASDLLLLCSDNEGSPTIIKEAMACNLPIVATDVGDVKDRLKFVDEAFLVEQSVNPIYVGMKKALNFTGIKKGRNEINRQGLDEKQLQKRIYNVYKSLCR